MNLSPSDCSDIIRLDTDPRVVKYIGTGAHFDAGGNRRDPFPPRKVYKLYPGSRQLARVAAGHRRLHRLVFVSTFRTPCEVEVGYRPPPDAWGQGFATEGASELVQYGFDDVGLDRIIGVTHKDNFASQRVLMKAGLADEGWGRYYGFRLRLFGARRADA